MSQLPSGRAATGVMFFVNGALFATWAARIPAIKDQAGLSDARMGLALLAISAGTIGSLPLVTALVRRLGTQRVLLATAVVCCTIMPIVGRAASLDALVPLLALLGAAYGSMDVAMNAHAARIERAAGRSIMSSFHGLWSLGGLVGAAAGGSFAAHGVGPALHFAVICGALVLLAAAARGGLAEQGRGPGDTGPVVTPLAWPSGAVLRIGGVAACAAVVEGGVANWSGLYLRDALGGSAGFSAAGFGAFSVAMMAGRFGGDRLIDRFGPSTLARAGAALTAGALAISLWLAHREVAVAAFAVSGLGMCTIFPLAFSAAARASGAGTTNAIGAVATMAYGASLLGPPLVGFAASAWSLPRALWLLVAGCVGLSMLANSLRRRAES